MVSWCNIRPFQQYQTFKGDFKSYEKNEKETVYISHPAILEIYNKFLGGFDKADVLLGLCNVKCKIIIELRVIE